MKSALKELEVIYAGQVTNGAAMANVVLASAGASSLGSLLWRTKYALSRRDLPKLVAQLARTIRRPGEAYSIARKIAEIAVQEHIDPRCSHCGGAGVVRNNARVQSVCTHCNGSGLAQTNDHERIRKLGCSVRTYELKWRDRIAQAHNHLTQSDSGTKAVIKGALRASS